MTNIHTRSATSAGTKVLPGKNAPVIQEAAGPVLNDSLAAESYRGDGKFAENRNSKPENATYSLTGEEKPGDTSSVVEGSQGGAAPTYINSQHISDSHGPHGKNLKEGGFDYQQMHDGQQKAFKSEVGSINDPSRLAELKFKQNEAAASRVASLGDTNRLSTKTAYDNLERDASP